MDCHLLALKQISTEEGFDIPDLFKDESYRISNYFSLSTSQVIYLFLYYTFKKNKFNFL